MVQGRLTITETQGVDLTLFKPRERTCAKCRPAYSFRANNTTLEFLCGPMASGKSPTCQPTINLSGFIAKQCGQSARLVFDTRAECQDFVAHDEDEASSSKLMVLSKRQNENHSRPGPSPPEDMDI